MIKFLKKIFLFGIILLGIFNFSNAGSYTTTGSVVKNSGTLQYRIFAIPLLSTINTNTGFSVSCTFSNSNFTYSNSKNNYSMTSQLNWVSSDGYGNFNNIYSFDLSTIHNNGTISFNYTSSQLPSLSYYYAIYFQLTRSTDFSGSFDWSCTVSGDNIVDVGGSSSCESDLSSCQSNLNSCQGDLASSELSLSSCQSSLNSCQSNLSGYDLTLNSCSNNLNSCNSSLSQCLQANCPTNSGEVSRSSLFINNIQHVGAGIIDITIPEEISWDYSNSGDIFELDVSGYNVDPEYIEDILEVQTFHPSSEDFTQSFTGTLVLLLPYIIIVLFIMFIWKLLRRIFK